MGFSSFSWGRFVSEFEAENKYPVLQSLLKKCSLLQKPVDSENAITIACPNQGARIYLETKRSLIEQLLTDKLKYPTRVVFTIKETRGKKESALQPPLPIKKEERKKEGKVVGVEERFVFENFAVSQSNQIAHAAAQTVSERPGNAYNPLFIYGGVGFLKTHLAHALANKIHFLYPDKKILFCSSEEFTNDLIRSIREKETHHHRSKYRHLDILIVDDIQFIGGKIYVQEEFYHTFNTIIKKGGQIVLTSDQPPSTINKLEDRLRSRFSGGLTIDIQKPDFELRTAIVLIKAKERNVSLDMETARLIAEQATDARALEGRLFSFMARATEQGQSLSHQSVVSFVEKELNNNQVKPSPQKIAHLICSFYNVSFSLLRGPSRKEKVAFARHVAMFLIITYLNMTL